MEWSDRDEAEGDEDELEDEEDDEPPSKKLCTGQELAQGDGVPMATAEENATAGANTANPQTKPQPASTWRTTVTPVAEPSCEGPVDTPIKQ